VRACGLLFCIIIIAFNVYNISNSNVNHFDGQVSSPCFPSHPLALYTNNKLLYHLGPSLFDIQRYRSVYIINIPIYIYIYIPIPYSHTLYYRILIIIALHNMQYTHTHTLCSIWTLCFPKYTMTSTINYNIIHHTYGVQIYVTRGRGRR